MGKTYQRLIDKLHWGEDPYTGFDPDRYPHEVWGWDSEHPWFGECIEQLRPEVIVEVGSWLVGSAIHMAGHLQRLGLDAAVVCVDTWLGERQLWSRVEHRETLGFLYGRPTVYSAFMANVVEAGLQKFIVPLSMNSTSGAHYLEFCDITADMVYIDGCHDEGEVHRDLVLYWERLRAGGRMLIDDYVPDTNHNEVFHGLIRDVRKFAEQNRLAIQNSGRKAMMEKIV